MARAGGRTGGRTLERGLSLRPDPRGAGYGIDGLQTRGDLKRFIADVLQDPAILPRQSPISLVKAGPVSDADFPRTPRDNTMALDTSNLRLYIRVAGTWRYTALT